MLKSERGGSLFPVARGLVAEPTLHVAFVLELKEKNKKTRTGKLSLYGILYSKRRNFFLF